MALTEKTHLQQVLQSLHCQPKRSLSQNFLVDANILKQILDVAQVQSEEWIVEIGPGVGVLTQALLEKNARVIAIEKDQVFASYLRSTLSQTKHLEVFSQDFLSFPLTEILSQRLKKGEKAKAVANLPYHITAPIFSHLMTAASFFSSLTLMVQEEVAERILAKPKQASYGFFTLFLRHFTHATYGFHVPAHCFYPQPKVSSAVVHLEITNSLPNEPFLLFMKTAFQQRRKLLTSSLQKLYPKEAIRTAFHELSLPETLRPEECDYSLFLQIFQKLKKP